MSRAIIFRFSESASLRIMAEEGLNNVILSEMRGDIGVPATKEIHGNLENFDMYEMQVDIPTIQATSNASVAAGTPEITYTKKGIMTFIEIFIPNESGYGGHDLQDSAVSESILAGEAIQPNEIRKEKTDEVDFENISLQVSDLMEFSLEPGFGDAIKALEASGQDFSLQALEGAFDVFKSLPAHKDMDDFKDFMSEIRKKHREKVRVEAKVKSN